MSINSDAAFVVLEYLSKAQKTVPSKELIEELPFERKEIMPVLTALQSIGLLEKTAADDGGTAYSISKDISAYHITKAVELGVDIVDLSSLLTISEKQKKAALALSSESQKLKELDDSRKAEWSSDRGRPAELLPRDAIVDTLERLALASEISIEDFARKPGESEEILKALHEARGQALKALREYQTSLAKWGRRADDFS